MNWTPRQIVAGLFVFCGLVVGYSVATNLFQAQAQDSVPGQGMDNSAPPPTESLPPTDLPPLESTPPGLPGTDPALAPPQPVSTPLEPALRVVNPEGFIYNPEGLRDPFFPVRKGGPKLTDTPTDEVKPNVEMEFDPREPLQSERLMDYRLVGVLWDVKNPRALIQHPQGKILTVRRKYRLGREGAVVVAIRESEIVVAEPNPDGTYTNATTRVISMKK